ncbi:MAG: alpha-xylosidase [Oscillospiraceae bacterium]|nr:alpha-xylosidase [Oscillospiraceae bacterium]
MKFTNGYWRMREGVTPYYAVEYAGHEVSERELIVYASTCAVTQRGDVLNRAVLTITFSAPMPGAVATELLHHRGNLPAWPEIPKQTELSQSFCVTDEGDELVFTTGLDSDALTVTIDKRPNSWSMSYRDARGKLLTDISYRNMAYMLADGKGHTVAELQLSVGELVYGLGERFTPFVKNGQVVEMWNEDGGTASDIAYKNIPFYLSNRGYGVLVDTNADVAFEIASEKVSRVQFSLAGERLRYLIFAGPEPKDVIGRYTALTGRPALVPAWSFGLWLTTSFTTSYDEETVNSFINGMTERNIPLHVFHFDCFWMRKYTWCDFIWDPEVFPDPQAMLARLKASGLKICVWINPYIAQNSVLFNEGMEKGYLLKRRDGSVWQTDLWQAGTAIVDFTNPGAVRWYQDKLETLTAIGVDCFKTDFGERIPVRDIVWYDGSDPVCMHNAYPYFYNQAVFEVLEKAYGTNNACLFARSASAGAQRFPVHWGGDCSASYVSMAETLRGGLSLSLCGFGFWSHDIGGFEQTATADLYKRWCAFGMLSTHSRLHGSTSYRVPWLFDEEACDVLRHFVELKCGLMPYIFGQAVITHKTGLPLMRPMLVDFPEDLACHTLDTQYMLGESLMIAPVFSEDGEVSYYLPKGRWTHYMTNEIVTGGRYCRERHDYFSLPIMVRPNTVLVSGAVCDKPDYDYADGMTVRLYELAEGCRHTVSVPDGNGDTSVIVTVEKIGKTITVTIDKKDMPWNLFIRNATEAVSISGGTLDPGGTVIVCDGCCVELIF